MARAETLSCSIRSSASALGLWPPWIAESRPSSGLISKRSLCESRRPPSGSLVRIAKLRATPNAPFGPGTWGAYVPGGQNPGVSFPVDYVAEGILLRPPELRERVLLLRLVRNGERALGTFDSGPVVSLGGWVRHAQLGLSDRVAWGSAAMLLTFSHADTQVRQPMLRPSSPPWNLDWPAPPQAMSANAARHCGARRNPSRHAGAEPRCSRPIGAGGARVAPILSLNE